MHNTHLSRISNNKRLWSRQHNFEIHFSQRFQSRKVTKKANNCCFELKIRRNFTFWYYFSSTFSRLAVSFKDETFIPMTRSETHDMNDFIATFGGLFTLFIGASVLSIIELIYYSTIRIYFAYKNGKQMKNRKRSVILKFVAHNQRAAQRRCLP